MGGVGSAMLPSSAGAKQKTYIKLTFNSLSGLRAEGDNTQSNLELIGNVIGGKKAL